MKKNYKDVRKLVKEGYANLLEPRPETPPPELQIHTRNGAVIHCLSSSVSHGIANISNIPALLDRVIAEDMWKTYIQKNTKRLITHNTLEQFVKAPILEGLDCDLETLKDIRDLVARMKERGLVQ